MLLACRWPQSDAMLTLYDFLPSGNGYKVRLLLTQLGIAYRLVELDTNAGQTRTSEFLAKNPNGRIPTVEFEDGSHLFESGALLWYFAEDTAFMPPTKLERAQTLQWMFFEQYSHEPYVAVVRAWKHVVGGKLTPLQEMELPGRIKRGYDALDVMESHLATRKFFVGERYGLADIALYAYTHVADEGEFELQRYPAIGAWMKRVASQPRHIPITARPA
jgi:glutathione S-transferase